jgi:long-chain acyl-CoA synthetase
MGNSQLPRFLEAAAQRSPETSAVVFEGGRWSWAELAGEARARAELLRREGLTRMDRVAILGDSSAETVAWIWATLLAEVAFVVVDPLLPGPRRRAILQDSGARVVIEGDCLRPTGSEVSDGSRSLGHDQAPASLIYTSGSRGPAKGVAMSTAAMSAAVLSISEYLELRPTDRIWGGLPLHYGYGLYQIFLCAAAGATLVLPETSSLLAYTMSVLDRFEITTLPGVPSLWAQLLESPRFGTDHLPHLSRLTNAGDHFPRSMILSLRDRFPRLEMHAMYGLSECTRVSSLPPDEIDDFPSSVGVPMRDCEVRIVDERGQSVRDGVIGELVVRGPHLMLGYWNRPDETKRVLHELPTDDAETWLWTGDWFRQDSDGRLYHCGRRDDLFKCRGQKVSPRLVADALETHPDVLEAVVLPRRNDQGDVEVHAVLRSTAPSLDHRQLRHACRQQLASHEVPTSFELVSQLPRTSRGKIDRDALQQPNRPGDHAPCS